MQQVDPVMAVIEERSGELYCGTVSGGVEDLPRGGYTGSHILQELRMLIKHSAYGDFRCSGWKEFKERASRNCDFIPLAIYRIGRTADCGYRFVTLDLRLPADESAP